MRTKTHQTAPRLGSRLGSEDYPEAMPESEEQVRERHLRWARRNGKMLTTRSRQAYQESGRGYWIGSRTPESTDLVLEYVAGTEHVPDDATSRHLAQMVRNYDPAKGFVLVVRELDGTLHAYGFKDEQ